MNIDLKKNRAQILELLSGERFSKLVDFLNASDYFEAPASARHHLNVEGGLAQHSLNVYHLLRDRVEYYDQYYGHKGLLLHKIPEGTIRLTALCHDLCKVDFYAEEQAWRKDDRGKWESYTRFGYDDAFPLGHGEKSVILLQRILPLSMQETLMIRWHMGVPSEYSAGMAYSRACEMEPGVVLLHSADAESIVFLEREESQ